MAPIVTVSLLATLPIALSVLLAFAPSPIPSEEITPVVAATVLVPVDVESLRNMSIEVALNTCVPLKVVFEPMRSISALIAVNSASSAVL